MTSWQERASTPSAPRGRKGRWSSVAGAVIGLLGLAFVVRTLIEHRGDVSDAFDSARPVYLLVALVAAAAGMTGIGMAWRVALRVLGADLPLVSALRGYFVGQLGKYVPGGVWAIMGRGEWARSAGVPATLAYSSVFLSMGSAYLAAVVLVALLVPLSGLLASDGNLEYLLLIFLLLPIGFLLIHPRVVAATLRVVRRVSKRELAIEIPRWPASAGVVLRQVPSWVLIGSANLFIALALGAHGGVVNVISATAVAWVVGFMALPVPGGIGVREAVFVALATSLPTGVAATVAIVARLLFVTVDAAGAASMSLLLARGKVSAT